MPETNTARWPLGQSSMMRHSAKRAEQRWSDGTGAAVGGSTVGGGGAAPAAIPAAPDMSEGGRLEARRESGGGSGGCAVIGPIAGVVNGPGRTGFVRSLRYRTKNTWSSSASTSF